MGAWSTLVRPFTLLPPAIGMASGALCAIGLGAVPETHDGWTIAWHLLLGAAMAATLNAASNVWNQIEDLRLDRVNKPARPLVTGAISVPAARRFAFALYALAIGLACLIRPAGVPELAIIVIPTAIITWAYSSPPLRLRRSWWGGPLAIAIPRGGLLKLAGWASVAPIAGHEEPWAIAGIFFLFVLGAGPTKDFGDMRGDGEGGCSSLPLRFGPRRAACIMAPFYVLPWLGFGLLPTLFPQDGLNTTAVLVVAGWLTARGLLTAFWLVRRAERLTDPARSRAEWINLYVLMMEAQIGTALVFFIR